MLAIFDKQRSNNSRTLCGGQPPEKAKALNSDMMPQHFAQTDISAIFKNPNRYFWPLLAGLILLFTSTVPARADLRVCNQIGKPVSVALGYRANGGWQSEGWWVIAPDACTTVFQGDLNARFYYLFAADDISGGSWDGSVFMCTRDEIFTIFGVEDCLARGYERTGFFEIDTESRSDWTLQLTETDISRGTE